ncbi:clumping factor A-like [Mytilus californianus]|uniref:clumping factor A-like n=1 Tax=Mytilus californianus TaxID=6549 RepID=UPI00224811D1|nr:clumping factor A-like [Mytilus californianus]
MAAEIESSDEEIVSPRRRRLSSGRKRQLFTDSGNDSSDAGNTCCTKQDKPSGGRSSERIRKRHSQEFRMPDKNEYWNKIPNCHSTVESVKSLTPRRVISNLTKVYNSYNADTCDSDEDEMSEFIVEDDEIDDENSTSDKTDDDEKRHTGRIDRSRTEFSETKLHRLREISSSDSESEANQVNNAINEEELNEDSIYHTNNDPSVSKSKLKRRKSNIKVASSSDGEKDESVDDTLDNEHFEKKSESESDDNIQSTSSKRKRSIESSDSDSDPESKTSESRRMSATTRTTERLKQRQELFRELKETRQKSS